MKYSRGSVCERMIRYTSFKYFTGVQVSEKAELGCIRFSRTAKTNYHTLPLGGLKQQKFILTALEARSLKVSFPQCCFHCGGSGQEQCPSPISSLSVAASNPLCSSACRSITPVCSCLHVAFSPCVFVSSHGLVTGTH